MRIILIICIILNSCVDGAIVTILQGVYYSKFFVLFSGKWPVFRTDLIETKETKLPVAPWWNLWSSFHTTMGHSRGSASQLFNTHPGAQKLLQTICRRLGVSFLAYLQSLESKLRLYRKNLRRIIGMLKTYCRWGTGCKIFSRSTSPNWTTFLAWHGGR